MAYLPKTKKQQEEEQISGAPTKQTDIIEDDQVGAEQQITGSPGATGGSPQVTSTGGGGGSPTAPIQTAQTPADSRFGKLRRYLQTNQPGAYRRATQVDEYLGQQREDTVGSAIQEQASALQQQIQEGTPQVDQELIGRAVQDPTQLSQEETQRVQELRQAQYQGPEEFDVSPIESAREQYQQRLQQLGTEQGMQTILEELPDFQKLTPGQQSMERALLMQDPAASEFIQGRGEQYRTMSDEQLEQARTQALERIQAGQTQAQTTQQEVQQSLSQALDEQRAAAEGQYQTATEETTALGEQIRERFMAGEQLDESELGILGISPTQYEQLQNYRQRLEQGFGGSEAMRDVRRFRDIGGQHVGYDDASGQYVVRDDRGNWRAVGRNAGDVKSALSAYLPTYGSYGENDVLALLQNQRTREGMRRRGYGTVDPTDVTAMRGSQVGQYDLPTYNPDFDFGQYLQETGEGPNIGQVTDPEQYARIVALNNLLGQQDEQFTEAGIDTAGTYAADPLEYDYQGALSQLQGTEAQYNTLLDLRRDQQRQAVEKALQALTGMTVTRRRRSPHRYGQGGGGGPGQGAGGSGAGGSAGGIGGSPGGAGRG